MEQLERGATLWVGYAQSVIDKECPGVILTVKRGKKYMKVMRSENGRLNGSAYAFIDLSSGDVFRPASWSVPAKHARCNVLDPDGWKKAVGAYGLACLR